MFFPRNDITGALDNRIFKFRAAEFKSPFFLSFISPTKILFNAERTMRMFDTRKV